MSGSGRPDIEVMDYLREQFAAVKSADLHDGDDWWDREWVAKFRPSMPEVN